MPFNYLVVEEPAKPAGGGRKIALKTEQISPELEAAIYAAAGVTPWVAPKPSVPTYNKVFANRALPMRGEGRRNRPVITGEIIDGFSQNIVAVGIPSLSLDTVNSGNAWRDERPKKPDGSGGPDPYEGQGVYTENVPLVTIRNFLGLNNGWQEDKPVGWMNMNHHNGYFNFGTDLVTIDDSIFVGASMAGQQPRVGKKYAATNCVFIGNGAALLAIMGVWELHHCTIYDPGLFTPDGGESFTGAVGVRSFWPGLLDDVWFVGRKGFPRLPAKAHPGAPVYPLACIETGGVWDGAKDHPLWKPPPNGAGIVASRCVVAGWPGSPKTWYKGGFSGQGVTEYANPIDYDPMPIVLQVYAGTLPHKDAIAKLHNDIRGAVH